MVSHTQTHHGSTSLRALRGAARSAALTLVVAALVASSGPALAQAPEQSAVTPAAVAYAAEATDSLAAGTGG